MTGKTVDRLLTQQPTTPTRVRESQSSTNFSTHVEHSARRPLKRVARIDNVDMILLTTLATWIVRVNGKLTSFGLVVGLVENTRGAVVVMAYMTVVLRVVRHLERLPLEPR